MAEVVGRELKLDPVRGHGPRRHHHPGVVDQQVEVLVVVGHLAGEATDRLQVGEVEEPDLDPGGRHRVADRHLGLLRLPGAARGPHNGRAGAGELARRDQAEAAVGAGDDGRAAALVGDLVGCPAGHGPDGTRLEAYGLPVICSHLSLPCVSKSSFPPPPEHLSFFGPPTSVSFPLPPRGSSLPPPERSLARGWWSP